MLRTAHLHRRENPSVPKTGKRRDGTEDEEEPWEKETGVISFSDSDDVKTSFAYEMNMSIEVTIHPNTKRATMIFTPKVVIAIVWLNQGSINP